MGDVHTGVVHVVRVAVDVAVQRMYDLVEGDCCFQRTGGLQIETEISHELASRIGRRVA
jgi:hypothetical protein